MVTIFNRSVHIGRRSVGVLLVIGGVLIGSLLSSPGVGLAGTTTQTRAVSCGVSAFRPVISGTSFTIGSAQVLYRNAAGGSPEFRCDPGLPQNAVVTKFQVTAADYTSDGEMGACELRRFDLEAATAGTSDVMAQVPETGYAALPGKVRLTDSSIAFATVKNGRYAYAVQCELGSDPSAGLFGATVTFTITAANG